MASCLRKTRTVLSVTKALVCRGMFVLHGLICIWRVTVIKSSVLYWALAGSLPLVVMETVYTICKKKNGEWKWVCPSVLLYLATTVPAIWFLELDVMTHRSLVSDLRPLDQPASDAVNASEEIHLGKIQLAISLGSEEWCKVLEQMLLLILIMGRWLLPKGDITREQLSQLLLVYIGMAADIIELFEAFKEDKVRENKLLNLTILSLWTASLTQFTLVLTATKSKRRRTSCVVSDEGGGAASCSNGVRGCCPTEVLSILLSVFLQDAPFLVLRMLLIFRYNVLSYSNIFFTSKNSLVLMLQIYRLIVLFTDSPEPSAPKARPRERHIVVTSGSSKSNSLSFSSDSDDSFSDGSDFGNSSDGSDWAKLRKMTDKRGKLKRDVRINSKGDSGSNSFDTDQDSIAGTNLTDGKTVLVMTSSKHDPTRARTGRGKDKLQRRSMGGMWVCRYQNRPNRKSKGHGVKDDKKTHQHPGNDPQNPSPVLPPPPESLNTNEGADMVGNGSSNHNHHSTTVNNNNYTTKTISRNNSKSSPKASPSRGRPLLSKEGKRLQDSPDTSRRQIDNDRLTPTQGRRQHDLDRKSYGSRSRRHSWSSIKGLQSVLAVLEDKGKYHTVVLKHATDGSPVYVIDHEKNNGHNISV